MPMTSISTDARTPPIETPALAATSSTANTADAPALDVPRWSSVRPETSISALATPTTASATIATSVTGTKPITAIGAPQPTSAMANTSGQASLGADPERPEGADDPAQADRRPQHADAGVAHAQDLDREHGEERGQRARTTVWPTNDTITMPAGGRPRSSRTPATNGIAGLGRARPTRRTRRVGHPDRDRHAGGEQAQPGGHERGRRDAEPRDHQPGDQRPTERAQALAERAARCWR